MHTFPFRKIDQLSNTRIWLINYLIIFLIIKLILRAEKFYYQAFYIDIEMIGNLMACKSEHFLMAILMAEEEKFDIEKIITSDFRNIAVLYGTLVSRRFR